MYPHPSPNCITVLVIIAATAANNFRGPGRTGIRFTWPGAPPIPLELVPNIRRPVLQKYGFPSGFFGDGWHRIQNFLLIPAHPLAFDP